MSTAASAGPKWYAIVTENLFSVGHQLNMLDSVSNQHESGDESA